MKKLLILAVALTGMYSCQNNQNENTEKPIEAGSPTQMSVSLVIPQTYAANDPNATVEEMAVKTVDVFIYNDNNLFLKRAALTISDFTYDGSGTNHAYVGTTKIATTTGAKKIYVGVNLPSGLAAKIETNGPSAAQEIANILDMTSATDGFAMFSSVAASKTLTSNDSENVVPVTVKRLVAKISVKEGTALDLSVAGGIVSNMEFTVKNTNIKYFPLPWDDAGTIKDPNWASVNPLLDYSIDPVYIAASPRNEADNAKLAKKYVLENTMQGTVSSAYQDEATYVSIRVQFVPSIIVTYKNGIDKTGGYLDENNSSNTPQNFFQIVNAEGKSIYALDYDIIKDYADDKGLDADKIKGFGNAFVYYHTYLNKAKKFNIFRNDFYKVNVTKLIGLGEPTEHTPDHVEIPTDANMTVDIEILNWNLVNEDVELIGQ